MSIECGLHAPSLPLDRSTPQRLSHNLRDLVGAAGDDQPLRSSDESSDNGGVAACARFGAIASLYQRAQSNVAVALLIAACATSDLLGLIHSGTVTSAASRLLLIVGQVRRALSTLKHVL